MNGNNVMVEGMRSHFARRIMFNILKTVSICYQEYLLYGGAWRGARGARHVSWAERRDFGVLVDIEHLSKRQHVANPDIKAAFHWGNKAICCMRFDLLSTKTVACNFQHMLHVASCWSNGIALSLFNNVACHMLPKCCLSGMPPLWGDIWGRQMGKEGYRKGNDKLRS